MAVRVKDASGDVLEVTGDEATEGIAAGRFTPADDLVRVVSGDNKTGRVKREKLSTALAQGWSIATEEEAAAKKLRREASSTSGTLKHGGLAVARGASLGATDLAAQAFGMSAEELAAGQEALGGAGTALEAGGAIAATALSGGAAGAGQAAVRGGSLSARLAGGALRAVAAPSRLAARAAGGVERALVGGAEAGLGRRVAAKAAGEALDGALGGMAGAVDESVIHDKDLTAEALVGGTLAGAAFGGAVGGGVGLGSGALSRALRGVELKRGGQVPDDAVREAIGREVGLEASAVPDSLLDAAKVSDGGWLSRAMGATAPLSGADAVVAKRVGAFIEADPKRAADIFNRQGAIEKEAADVFQTRLPEVQAQLADARKISQGEAKYKANEARFPKNADVVSPKVTALALDKIDGRLAQMEQANAETFARSYDPGALREARALAGRARQEMLADATEGASPSVGVSNAASSFRAVDRLKRDLSEQIRATGGWGPPKMGVTTDAVATNKALREVYDDLKGHLERTDLWGENGEAQAAINASFAKAMRAEEDLRGAAKGSGIGNILGPEGTVNARAFLTLARQYKRIGGDQVVDKLDAALEAQLEHLRTVQRYYDTGPDGAAKVAAAEQAVKDIRKKFESQAEVAGFLDDANSLRESEGNRSVSIGSSSGIGTVASTLVGGAIAGPIGAAAGAVAGAVFRPYSTARSMASLLALTGSFGKRFDGARLVAKLRAHSGGIGAAVGARVKAAAVRARGELEAAGRSGVRAAAFQFADGTPEERAKKVRELSKRVVTMSSPESLRKALGPELEVLAAEAPETAAAIEIAVARAAAFLASKLPTFTPGNPFSGSAGHVNPQEVDRWLRYRGAILAPGKVVSHILDGTVTHEEIEALEAVYPRHLQQLREGAIDACASAADSGEPLPYQARLSLGRALGIPLDDAHTPERIGAVQALYAAAPQPDPAPRTATKGADSMDPMRLATPTEQIAAGG